MPVESRERDALLAALASAPVALVVVDRDGALVAAGGGAAPFPPVPIPAGEAPLSLFELWDDQPDLCEALRAALGGEAATVDLEAAERAWEVRLAPLAGPGPGREAGGAVALFLDRTARRLAEREAERSLWFLDALVENIPNMIFVKDAQELRFVRFNRAGEELLGYDRRELIGKNDYDFFPRPEADFFTSKDRTVLSEGRMVDIPEETIHTRTGVRVLHTKKIPIEDQKGRPVYLLGISEDITERKQVEAERQELYERLREVDRLKTHLIANVSHEFRTPLALIQARAHRLLADKPSGHPDRDDLEGIGRGVKSLLGLVSDLLDVAALETGKPSADYAEIDLAHEVRLWGSAFEVVATERDLDLEIDTPAELTAQVDPWKLQRAVMNLLSNALRHAPAGGRVRLSLSSAGPPEQERIRIEVADSGPGIPEELRARVFERFFQIDRGPRAGGGIGLGLAIVKEFVELHGGTIDVDDAPGGGALFALELPRLAPRGAKVGPAPAEAGLVPPPPAPVALPKLQEEDDRPRVLVVEDHAELRAFLVETLAPRYQVSAATDGAEGLELALERPPDLILTDVMMPKMGGDELLAAARARPELREVPIVVLTARDDDELRVRLLREGAADYLTKPFSPEELLARLENLVAVARSRQVLREALSTTRQDLEELSRDLARRRAQLEAALHQREEFLSIASHELNTPMMSLMLLLQGLEQAWDQGMDRARLGRMVELAGRQGKRLARLIDELLDVTRISRSGVTLAREPVDLALLVQEAITRLEPELQRVGCAVAFTGPEQLPARLDPSRVEQVVTNLLANAAKFGKGKPIEVELEDAGALARLSVRDHGIGIEPEAQGRIFDLFERGVSPRHYGGLGLGLYVTRQIVEAHGGTIRVHSRPGEGATFVVELPRAPG